MLAVLKHSPKATAGDMQASLSEAIGREQAFGSIFTTLDRLTEKKFVKWRKGLPDETRGGRAPRLYTTTAKGRTTLIESLRAVQAFADSAGLRGLPELKGSRA